MKILLKGLSKSIFLAITALVLTLSVTTLGILTVTQTISSAGSVTVVSTPNLGVYSDSSCTQPLTSISWGSLTAGASTTKTVYIKNTGNVPLTLTMTPNSWSPAAASNYMTLTWNKQSSTLAVGQSTAAELTLTVDSDISGITTFSVNIAIVGTG